MLYLLPVFKGQESLAVLSRPVRCTSPPPGLDLASAARKSGSSPIFQTNSKLSLYHKYPGLIIGSIMWTQLTWFVSLRRGTNRRNQAGERGEKAAGVDEARVVKKGERLVGPKQTPQEPRWAQVQYKIKDKLLQFANKVWTLHEKPLYKLFLIVLP